MSSLSRRLEMDARTAVRAWAVGRVVVVLGTVGVIGTVGVRGVAGTEGRLPWA